MSEQRVQHFFRSISNHTTVHDTGVPTLSLSSYLKRSVPCKCESASVANDRKYVSASVLYASDSAATLFSSRRDEDPPPPLKNDAKFVPSCISNTFMMSAKDESVLSPHPELMLLAAEYVKLPEQSRGSPLPPPPWSLLLGSDDALEVLR